MQPTDFGEDNEENRKLVKLIEDFSVKLVQSIDDTLRCPYDLVPFENKINKILSEKFWTAQKNYFLFIKQAGKLDRFISIVRTL